jgi:zinc and cadmium transporter
LESATVPLWPLILTAVYCLLIAGASLAGGIFPTALRLTHTRMQVIMSFVGGLVLGVALLHLLPHSAAETGSLDLSVWAALAGLLTMFFLIRIFHVHQHGPVETKDHHHDHDHEHACDSPAHNYPVDGEHCPTHRHLYSWIGLFVGLALHTLIDGIALAASVSADFKPELTGIHLLGVGTFLAVLLHKPLDAMSITSVMAAGGWSVRSQHIVNIVFATMCALGAAAFGLGIRHVGQHEQLLVGLALGFAAGVFLCISLADILPEVQFHAHDRVKLSTALLLGILLAYAIGFLEPAHQHGGPPGAVHGHSHAEQGDPPAEHDHAHDDHGHDGHDH